MWFDPRRSNAHEEIKWAGVSSLPQLREISASQQNAGGAKASPGRRQDERSSAGNTCQIRGSNPAVLPTLREGLARILGTQHANMGMIGDKSIEYVSGQQTLRENSGRGRHFGPQ